MAAQQLCERLVLVMLILTGLAKSLEELGITQLTDDPRAK
jgi:hypothetical protein